MRNSTEKKKMEQNCGEFRQNVRCLDLYQFLVTSLDHTKSCSMEVPWLDFWVVFQKSPKRYRILELLITCHPNLWKHHNVTMLKYVLTFVHQYIYIYVYICMYIYIYMYVYIYIYIYIYIYMCVYMYNLYMYTYVCISAEPLSPFPFLLLGAAALRFCHLDLPWQRRGPGTTGAACHGQPDGEVPWCIDGGDWDGPWS